MDYILGIDQGGSKTHAVIGDVEGNILGLGSSYGACHSVKGMAYAMDAIIAATNMAIVQAEISLREISVIYAGMTGIDWDYEMELVKKALQDEFKINNVYVVNDCIIAMRAGTDKANSAVLCAGSGLNCALKMGDRELVYGFYVDDIHQGGMAIGERALRAVFNAEIGIGQETKITERLLNYFHVKNVDELLHRKVTGQISSREMLTLPIIVDKVAGENDEVALKLLYDFGREISQYIIAGMKKLDMLRAETEVVLSGSIFKCKTPILKDAVTSEIHCYASNTSIVEAFYEPVVGALLKGLDILCKSCDEQLSKRLIESADRFRLIRIKD